MKKYIFIPVLIFFLLIIPSCNEEVVKPVPDQSHSTSMFESDNAVAWMKLLYEIVSIEDIPAPESSRLYGYAGIATYESVFRGIGGARSLGGQLKQMPQMPSPGSEKYDWLSVMAATLRIVASGILYEPAQQ